MCHSHDHGSCLGCHHGISRRGFIRGCGAALATAGGVAAGASRAGEPKKPVRVALVFLSRERPSWPYPEFDIEAREKEILGVLGEGCPGVKFVPLWSSA